MNKILVVGFQRSGTTLLRRMIALHPEIKTILHEQFLLRTAKNVKDVKKIVNSKKINFDKDNWGEKVPYYPSARKYPIVKYCQTWEQFFGSESRIIHIVRHPYDVAISTVKKFKNIDTLDKPIMTYNKIIGAAIEGIGQLKTSYTFKYEDLLIDPDAIMYKVYKHCGVRPDFDFKGSMLNIPNTRYTKIDPTRAFAYKNENYKWHFDMGKTFEYLNSIDGIKYDVL